MNAPDDDIDRTTAVEDRLRDGRPQLGSALAGLRARVVASVVRGQPKQAGRYVLGRPLGSGNFGTVYEARDEKLDRKVAVKIVDSRSSATRQRVVREARMLASLSHPHVVQVFETGLTDEQTPRPYVVMELVDGGSLGQWLRERTRPWPRVVEVMRQAAQGLYAAHRAGIVHGDLKPENILLGSDERARVADFGLARFCGEPDSTADEQLGERDVLETSTTGLGGTPAYMAPEAFGGEQSPAIDQYALCVTFYEALFAERPFGSAQSVSELVKMLYQQTPTLPGDRRGIPPHILAVVMRGLQRDPDARFASMQELIDALDEPRGGRAGLRIGIAAGVLAALSLGVASLWRAGPPSGDQPEVAAPDPQRAAAIGELEAQRDELRALLDSAQLDQALARAPALLERAQALGHPPLVVDLTLLRGRAMAMATDYEHAIPVIERAYFLAQDHDLPRPMAYAASELIGLWGYEADKYEDAHRWQSHADAAFDRAGLDPRRHPPYMSSIAGLAAREGDLTGAIAILREAIANVEGGDQAGTSAHANLLKQLSRELYVSHEAEEAIAVLERAMPLYAKHHGVQSHSYARAVDNLGVYLSALERYDEALVHHQQALRIREAVLEDGHIDLARSHGNLGRTYGLLGRYDEAFAHTDRSIALFTARLGAGNASVGMGHEHKGQFHAAQGDVSAALAEYDRAARIYDAAGVIYAPTAERVRKAIEALGGTPPPRPSVAIAPEL